MSIKLLVADDSQCMLSAMRHVLEEEPQIEIVGEARTFPVVLEMIANFKPDVLLLDLRLAQNDGFTADFVKPQLDAVKNVVAVSFANDPEAQDLAKRYGARVLLDKMNLYAEMVPTILHSCEVHQPIIE
ncbi:MAG TPA: response regulator [Candidatus Acidoferrum sp.]